MNLKDEINKYVKIAQSNISQYLVVMISNVKNITGNYNDYDCDSVISEYYSYSQYEEILTSLRKIGFEVICYFDENAFMIDFLSGKLNRISKKLLILNSAQTGTGSGRKSLIPAFCELNGLIHTNSDSFISSYTRQKYHWFCYLKRGGFPVANSWLYHWSFGWYQGQPMNGDKVLIKLNREASSIGLSEKNIITYNSDNIDRIDELSRIYSQPIIVQKFIEGYEVEVPCIVSKTSSISFEPTGIQVNSNRNLGDTILNYNVRGEHLFSFYDFSEINKQLSEEIKKTTEEISCKMSLFGLARIDYRITEDNEFYVTDVSSNPHITKSMTFNYLYTKMGYSYEDVLLTLLGISIDRGIDK